MNDEKLEKICQHYGIRKQLKKLSEEVFERATQKWESGLMTREELEDLFPDLAESEDEKIREWCISHFKAAFRVSKDNAEYQEYLNSKVIPWLEKQGEKNLANSAKICKENKEIWSEEDERLCRCLIKDQKKALDDVRNDKYGHSEIVSDLKEMYNERITWLKSLKERAKNK